MSLLREETKSSPWEQALCSLQQHPGIWRARKSELGTEALKVVAPPSWAPNPKLNQAMGSFSRGSSQLSPASAAQPCTSVGSHGKSFALWESMKCQIQSGPKWVAKFLKILTQALYLWASAIIWTGERQKWAAVAPAIPWNSSVYHPDYCIPFSDFQQIYKSLFSGGVTPQYLLLNALSTSYFTLCY